MLSSKIVKWHGDYSVWYDFIYFSCNSNPRAPAPIKVAIAGGDGYMNLVLRPYVEQFSAKSHDWQNYIKFLFIPLGTKCSWSLFMKNTFDMYNAKPDTDVKNTITFISLGNSSLGKFLGALDSTYNTMFQDNTWKDTFEKSENQRPGTTEDGFN